MTTTTVGASTQGSPSVPKPRGRTGAESTVSDNSLFAALLQGSFVQPLTTGQKNASPVHSNVALQSLSASSQRHKPGLSVATAGKSALAGATAGLPMDGHVLTGSSQGRGTVKGSSERTANSALLLTQHPVDAKQSSAEGVISENGHSRLAPKNTALKTVSTTLAQADPPAQAGPLAQARILAQSTAKASVLRTGTASVNPALQHGTAYASAAEGDKAQALLPMESRVASLSANHGGEQQAVHRVAGEAPGRKPTLGNALDSAPQTTAWAAFEPVTTQPFKPASVSQPASPTVQFGDLKSVYDITHAMIGQADGGNQQIQVQVHPQGLGNLLISVVQTPDGIAVHMQAEQMATAQWLNGQSSSLINQLQQQGLDVAGVNVSFGSSNPQFGGSDGQQRRGRAIDGLATSRSVGSSTAVTGMGDDRLRGTQATSSTSWSGIGYSAWV